MTSRSIGQVAAYKPVHLCNIEELAAIQITRPSGGMLFARNPDREQKDAARRKILDLFTLEQWPSHLSILTMPGLDWRFERKLLGKRDGDWMRKAGPSITKFTCVENDRFIYYSAAHKMPGLNTRRALTKYLTPPSFAERTISTKFINEFHFANVDDLMVEANREHDCWDAVWLDYTGPLSLEKLKIISRFYHRSVRSTLIVTALKARWNKQTSEAILRSGGHESWLAKYLPGDVLHSIEYFDTSPMAQFAVRKSGYVHGEGK